MEQLTNVLNPVGLENDVIQVPLAPRPDTLNGKTVYLIESVSTVKSGFGDTIDRIKAYLTAKYPDIRFLHTERKSYSADDPVLWKDVLENSDAYIYFGAPFSSTIAYAMSWPARVLERQGKPGVVLIYEYLENEAQVSQAREGMWIRYVKTPYPYEANPEEEKADIPRRVEEALLRPLEGRELDEGLRTPEQPPRYVPAGTEDEVLQYFFDQGWTDGLPVVLPTEERVQAMLKGTSHSPDEVIATNMAPEGKKVTVEKVAINAVMAGALPSYLPVILAAVEIMGQDESYHATTKSTNSFSYCQVVNGPIRNEIGMNGGVYALGPGNRANAVIGRANRLALTNLGASKPGVNLMGVQGSVANYTFAFPENEEASPWESFAEHRGFGKNESVLTVMTGGQSHVGNYMQVKGMEACLKAVKTFEFNAGVTLLLAPQRARILAEEYGCRTYEDALDYILKVSSMPVGELKNRGGFSKVPKEYLDLPDDTLVPAYPKEELSLIVVGDPKGSDTIQGWALYRPKSTSIDKWR